MEKISASEAYVGNGFQGPWSLAKGSPPELFRQRRPRHNGEGRQTIVVPFSIDLRMRF